MGRIEGAGAAEMSTESSDDSTVYMVLRMVVIDVCRVVGRHGPREVELSIPQILVDGSFVWRLTSQALTPTSAKTMLIITRNLFKGYIIDEFDEFDEFDEMRDCDSSNFRERKSDRFLYSVVKDASSRVVYGDVCGKGLWIRSQEMK